MTVVTDASPPCYLILIGYIDVLPKLYENILTTQTVVLELSHPGAPESVREWSLTPPDWLDVRADRSSGQFQLDTIRE